MKMKKYLATMLLAALMTSVQGITASAVKVQDFYGELITVYNLNGETEKVHEEDLSYYLEDGWYLEPVCAIYSPNGYASVVFERERAHYLENGWYAYPVCTVYTIDGLSTLINRSELPNYLANGWYEAPVCTIYSPSGVSSIVYQKELSYYLENGWYETPVCMIYNPNGTSSVVLEGELSYYLANGWYANPVCTVYRADGSSAIIYEYELNYYLENGWSNLMIPMYLSDGTKITAPYIQIDIYKAKGWMTEMQYLCYLLDQMVASYGYDAVIDYIDEQLDVVENEQVWMTLYEKREALMDEWLIGNGGPLAITDWGVDEEYGIPEAWIGVRNLSDKTITAFDVHFVCYDAYGNVTTDYPNLYDGSYTGAADRQELYPGEWNGYSLSLYSNSRTASISKPYVTRVAFSDGTTWYR